MKPLLLCFILALAGCGFLERAGETARTPQPLFDGKTPIQVMISSAEKAATGSYVDAAIQAALALGTIIAGGFAVKANSRSKRTERKVKNGAVHA